MKDMVTVWVHKDFQKKIKREALNNDLSILEYTEKLGRRAEPFDDDMNEMRKQKKRGFDFKL